MSPCRNAPLSPALGFGRDAQLPLVTAAAVRCGALGRASLCLCCGCRASRPAPESPGLVLLSE